MSVKIGFQKVLLYFFDISSNELIVEVEKPLLKSKVKIELSCEDYNNIVLYKGEEKKAICNEYGPYHFLVSYDNKYYAKFRHFRENWHDQYSYTFKFQQVGKSISVSLDIDDMDWKESSLMMKPKGLK